MDCAKPKKYKNTTELCFPYRTFYISFRKSYRIYPYVLLSSIAVISFNYNQHSLTARPSIAARSCISMGFGAMLSPRAASSLYVCFRAFVRSEAGTIRLLVRVCVTCPGWNRGEKNAVTGFVTHSPIATCSSIFFCFHFFRIF